MLLVGKMWLLGILFTIVVYFVVIQYSIGNVIRLFFLCDIVSWIIMAQALVLLTFEQCTRDTKISLVILMESMDFIQYFFLLTCHSFIRSYWYYHCVIGITVLTVVVLVF